jgi:hypothetical protein
MATSKLGKDYYRISYSQKMRKFITVGVTKRYDIIKGCTLQDKQSIALSIFLGVSKAFEQFQDNLFLDSGFSAEDLVSNLVGFYKAVGGIQFLNLCEPVSKEIAFDIWDTYGSVGSNKNYTGVPFIYPINASFRRSPTLFTNFNHRRSLPPLLTTIQPAKPGRLFVEVPKKPMREWNPRG